tara:strand:+ start:317 stop:637 length:321 start_codon:yes stop_codon:yes gene_type:complete
MSLQKVTPQDLLTHFNIDDFVRAANDTVRNANEEIADFIFKDPKKARELFEEALFIAQLEELLEDANKHLVERKTRQSRALRQLAASNRPGRSELQSSIRKTRKPR